ncbi:sensor of ECF-type sigma factor [Flavobacterium sp.]|uniref:sensor of ECF-type sigma factor n=1 Tax=Flavobacterium sp. TaxID=239 RepID=UPI0026086CEA|nr:sensor of ECF-type sigma factor [Flavobacterium sp.]
MKKYKIITLLIFLISTTTFAQGGKLRERFQQKKEQVKSLKVAYITEELKLTSSEAEKFWPLYNAFEEKQMTLRKDKLKNYLDRAENADDLSEKEATTLISQMESAEEELHQLRKKFVASLKGVLPSVKILKLKKAEDEFNRKLLQQYRDKKVGR